MKVFGQSSDKLRLIPAVDDILGVPEMADLRARYPALPWTRLVRDVTADAREGRLEGLPDDRDGVRAALVRSVRGRISRLQGGGLRRVLNGTGVILHTNLGRAVPGDGVREAVSGIVAGYSSLEVDLDTGDRGHRGEVLSDLLSLAAGAEAAMVVNNNAAAVYLVVNSYSPPGRVLISRGELVEIGGSFRLPDILSRASLEMVEVGTTNRTYIADYEKVARPGDILLRAHRSNYQIEGFTHDTTLAELSELARERECHFVYDLGSGSFFDFDAAGVSGEERVSEVLEAGVDCVTMSGDKLLGGLQAGIIVGRKKFLERLRDNPLRRAVRVDKVTIAALQSLMRSYLFDADPAGAIPMLGQSTGPAADLRKRADNIIANLPDGVRSRYDASAEDDSAAIGGGSFAGRQLPSAAVTFRCPTEREAVRLERRLRTSKGIPVIARIKGREVRINLRTILPSEDGELVAAIEAALHDKR